MFGVFSIIFFCFCFGCALGGYARLRFAVRLAFSLWLKMVDCSLKKRKALKVLCEYFQLSDSFKDENASLERHIDILQSMTNLSWRMFLRNTDEIIGCFQQMEEEIKSLLRKVTIFLEQESSNTSDQYPLFIACLEDIWAADNLYSFHLLAYETAVEKYNSQRNGFSLRLGRELFRFNELCRSLSS